MQVLDRIDAFRKELDAARMAGRTVGLVPTMGYLHEGHASLIRRSAAERDVTAVTVFVNPLQFGANEDLAAYPRDLDRDVAIAEGAGAVLVFAPPVEEMYPSGPVLTSIHVAEVTEGMEGASRPGHFDGVATVVAKLFAIAGPCRAYFGEKDYQQLAVVRRMAADLSFPVDVVGCPIVREHDGLAMSSRNVYLSTDERRAATVLHRALQAGAADPAHARDVMTAVVASEPLADRQPGSDEIMRRRMMKSKIHRATVTSADLNYVGSISLDPALMERADIREWEQVAVLDIDNGARFETYAILGDTDQVQLNGAAARLVHPGDKVIIITYADYEEAELEGFQPIVVHVDEHNRPLDILHLAGPGDAIAGQA